MVLVSGMEGEMWSLENYGWRLEPVGFVNVIVRGRLQWFGHIEHGVVQTGSGNVS